MLLLLLCYYCINLNQLSAETVLFKENGNLTNGIPWLFGVEMIETDFSVLWLFD